MIIDRDSWHCRFIRFWSDGAEPRSLCTYFWTFVFSVFKAAGSIALLGFTVSAIPLLLWSWLHNHSRQAATVLAVVAVVAMFFVVIAALSALNDILKRRAKRVRSIGPASTLDVVVGTVAAWKQKVCPKIEYRWD